MKKYINIICLAGSITMTINSFGQDAGKIINRQDQSWVSINTFARVSDHWGFVADYHERRNNFFKDPGFHFGRIGVTYWVNDHLTITAGYANLLLAPATKGWKTFSDENRMYEQAQWVSKIGKVSMLQRIRNEQRWVQKIANDKVTGDNKFTDRIRFLVYFTVPVFKKPYYPSLALADELCIQFGKEVVYNTFDQNRIFFGVKQKLSKSLSFDLGYMFVLQQKTSGNVYDANRTFRWFFYYMPDFRKKPHTGK